MNIGYTLIINFTLLFLGYMQNSCRPKYNCYCVNNHYI